MSDLAVITYLWSPDERSKLAAPYTPDDVRKLARAVKANLMVPHSFICVTDHPGAFDGDPDIRAIPIDDTIPMDAGHCVCRLMTFHPNGREIFGADRVFQMDLDTLVIRNFDDVVMRDENVVLWRNPARVPWDNPSRPQRPYYNGSFVLHRCGMRSDIWENYLSAWRLNLNDRRTKDDQTWLSSFLGPDMPYWDRNSGIYRIARPGEPLTGIWGDLPDNAKLVTTPGSEGKPDNPVVREANPWLREYLDTRFGTLCIKTDNWHKWYGEEKPLPTAFGDLPDFYQHCIRRLTDRVKPAADISIEKVYVKDDHVCLEYVY